jgi:uroporphyrinogen-III decarboxylase
MTRPASTAQVGRMNEVPEELYNEREKRIMDTITLKKPDRVPVWGGSGRFATERCNISLEEQMMNVDKAAEACLQEMAYFDPDATIQFAVAIGSVLAPLDFKQLKWAGHGLSAGSPWQWVEMECMKSEEYDEFIYDPSDFIVRKYWSRAFGKMAPLAMMPPLREAVGHFSPAFTFMTFGTPEGQTLLDALKETGRAAMETVMTTIGCAQRMKAAGYPLLFGGGCVVPFDHVGDALRGRKGIMLDMYRRPDKLLQACEKMLPMLVGSGVRGAKMSGNPRVFIALHGGAEGFMSLEQYKRFYWPGFRELMVQLIDNGCYPFVLVEGGYDSRLELLADVPPGKVCYWFERVDMTKAKELFGGRACIAGNMPLTLLATGTPEQVREHARKLIDTLGKDGGYIMGPGGSTDDAKIENVKAMIDFTKEYGVY